MGKHAHPDAVEPRNDDYEEGYEAGLYAARSWLRERSVRDAVEFTEAFDLQESTDG